MKAKTLLGILAVLLLAAAMAFAAGTGEPEEAEVDPDFPTREIRLIIPYNPGGQSDTMGRQVAGVIEREELLDQPVVVTNIAGAGTRDALREVHNARPDGHTVLFHHSAMLTLGSLDLIPWHFTDFTVLAQVAQAPMVVVTRTESPYDSIQDLVDAAEGQPGEVQWAIQGGLGSNAHFIGEMLMNASGVAFRRVVYPGGAEARAAILGGHADWFITSLAESIPYVEAGDFKILGISSAERHPGLEEIPTLREQGVDMVFNIHSSIFAPADVPDSIKQRWDDVLHEVVNHEDYVSFMESIYTEPKFLPEAEILEAYQVQWDSIQDVARIVEEAADDVERVRE